MHLSSIDTPSRPPVHRPVSKQEAPTARRVIKDALTLSTAAQLPESPPGQALIVNANLMEVFPSHLGNPQEMRNFVDRLLSTVRYAPDALLVSEVTSESAARVADLLSKAIGKRFVLAVGPGNDINYPDGTKRDTAVILNADTMRRRGAGGLIRMTTDHSEKAADMAEPENKVTAYMSAREKNGGLKLSMASVHLSHNKEMATPELAERKKADWMDRIAETLEGEFKGKPHYGVIAGDYNNLKRYSDGRNKPFLDTLEAREYHDALAAKYGTKARGIDHLFSQAPVLDAFNDDSYDQKKAREDGSFYSDHKFQWMLVGTPTSQPAPPSERPWWKFW